MSRKGAAAGDDSDDPGRLGRWMVPRLLDWFDQHSRNLPWRRDRDPYRIWVSEVMLQQTQVATVIPYFERFLVRFPTLADLARADEQEVLRLWEGLGYYRRARHLLQAAHHFAEHHRGSIPSDPALLESVPGFGEYTRNAILSQAFDLPLPILEANTARLYSRLLGRTADPSQSVARKQLWAAAKALVPAKRAGDFNQALMELGALVCTPTSPRCEDCPLRDRCVAARSGQPEAYPARAARRAPTTVAESALVVRQGEQVLLVKRPPHASRWANLWEFPHVELRAGQTHEEAALALALRCGLEVSLGTELTTIHHAVTRFRIHMVCFEAIHAQGEFASEFHTQAVWENPAELAAYPVSSPQRKLARLVAASDRQGRLF